LDFGDLIPHNQKLFGFAIGLVDALKDVIAKGTAGLEAANSAVVYTSMLLLLLILLLKWRTKMHKDTDNFLSR
jgi:hypothetical protein